MLLPGIQRGLRACPPKYCRGLEVPLATELAAEALQGAEQQQEAEQRLARLMLQQRGRGRAEGVGAAAAEAADQAEELAAEAAAEAVAEDGSGTRHCHLCGGKAHRAMTACPVVQMALAVPKPPPGDPSSHATSSQLLAGASFCSAPPIASQ